LPIVSNQFIEKTIISIQFVFAFPYPKSIVLALLGPQFIRTEHFKII
jgi:hypothetical protein